LVNPFGARGMNSGIQDVVNLSWKLATVLRHEARSTFLHTYCEERSAANREHQIITRNTMRFIAPTSLPEVLRRNVILHLSRYSTYFRGKVNSGKMSFSPPQEKVIPIEYVI
jgi:2-polyprenyl-6-methoxyphenol hydroxylase-like FAD-dependent oxidoreductase